MLSSMEDALAWAPSSSGVMSLDFRNAFNTVDRHHVADLIRREVPVLAGVFKTLYNRPAKLFAKANDGAAIVIESGTGGRQGDPLMPFLFSLAMKELLKELEAFAVFTIPQEPMADQGGPDDEGDILEARKLIWAYLDDVFLVLRPGVTFDDVVNYLQQDHIVAKYGLVVNPLKCWFKTTQQMLSEGNQVLGCWVGGPADESSPASALTMDASRRVEERLSRLDDYPDLPLQHKLCLARLCFYPTINHLLRSLRPDVGVEGVRRFDQIIRSTVLRWIGDRDLEPDPLVGDTMGLPLKLGGLGFLLQSDLKPICAGTRIIVAQASLRERGLSLSMRYLSQFDTVIQLCSDNIKLPVGDSVLWDEYAKRPHLQKRFTELLLEKKWEGAFARSSSSEEKVRRLEALGPLARAWVQVLPTNKSLVLSDAEVRHGCRSLLMSSFREYNEVARSDLCARCFRRPAQGRHPISPTHFLACDKTQHFRSRRHHAICNAIGLRFQEVYQMPITREAEVGEFVNTVGRSIRIRSDVRFQRPDGLFADYDIGITTVHGRGQFDWPTAEQVSQAVVDQEARASTLRHLRALRQRGTDASTDDWSTFDALTHDRVKWISALRRLSWEAGVLPEIRKMHSDKVRHYQRANASVTPLIMTAGGSISEVTRDTFHNLCHNSSPADGSERAAFRRRMYGRLSVLLVRFQHFMGVDQLKFFGAQRGSLFRVGEDMIPGDYQDNPGIMGN